MTDTSGHILENICVKNLSSNPTMGTVRQGSRSMARGGALEITVFATGKTDQRAQERYFLS